jgi:hypothetical protein
MISDEDKTTGADGINTVLCTVDEDREDRADDCLGIGWCCCNAGSGIDEDDTNAEVASLLVGDSMTVGRVLPGNRDNDEVNGGPLCF